MKRKKKWWKAIAPKKAISKEDKAFLSEIKRLVKAAQQGKLDTRGDEDRFEGLHAEVIDGINTILDAVITPFKIGTEGVSNIAKGVLPDKITGEFRGDYNHLKESVNTLIDVVLMRNEGLNMLYENVLEGKLDVRADTSKYIGYNGKMIDKINTIIDSIVKPFKNGNDKVGQIAKGVLPERITEEFKGDYNQIKESVNTLIDVVLMRNEGLNLIYENVLEGRLDVRADTTRYIGYNGKMMEKINTILDSIVKPLKSAAACIEKISIGNLPDKITEESKGEFLDINNDLNRCIDAISSLIADATMLAQTSLDGKLSVRADAAKHQGDFQKIIRGVNDMLDAVILPVNEAAEVLSYVADNDLTQQVNGDYKGDHAKIKESLNSAIVNLGDMLSQVVDASAQVGAASRQISASAQGLRKGRPNRQVRWRKYRAPSKKCPA